MTELPPGFVLDEIPLTPGRPRITVTPASSDQNNAGLPPGFVLDGAGVGSDVAQSIPAGLYRGATALAGAPGDIGSLVRSGTERAAQWLGERTGMDTSGLPDALSQAMRMTPAGAVFGGPGSQEVRSTIEGAVPEPVRQAATYEPQTTAGKYVRSAAEFVPAAMAGPGGMIGNAVRYGVLPGLASEAAGQATEGTALEPWARGGAAIATGGAAAALSRPRTAEQAIRGQLGSVDDQVITQAQQLIDDAAAQGIRLSWAEAIEQVAPGRSSLPGMQRLVEASGDSRQQMAQFYGQRPAQVEAAAGPQLHAITPATPVPSTIGPAAGRAAHDAVTDSRQAINRTTDQLYRASAHIRLTPQEMAQVRALPGFAQAARAVRNDPQLNRRVANLPEDSVGFLNEVKKNLDQRATNAASAVSGRQNMQRSAGYGEDARAVRQAAINASRDPHTGASAYEAALNAQEQARRQFLEPILQGPIGRLADRDITTRKAIAALFPANPVPNSAWEVTTAVTALAARNEWAARQLVRAHIESVFNEATQNLVGGAAQRGGAKFAAVLAGNQQQRANLQAAIEALPNGQQTWAGFNRFIDVLEATGRRPEIGSRTSFNTSDLADLATGKWTAETAKTIASPSRLLSVVSDAWGRYQLGSNLNELAAILTNPQSGQLLRQITNRPAGAREAQIIAARLVAMGHVAGTRPPNETGNR